MNTQDQITLRQLLITPSQSLRGYFKLASDTPLDFIRKIDLGEHLKYAVYVSLIIGAVNSLPTILSSSLFDVLLTFFGILAAVFIGAALQYAVALIAKSEIDYRGCLNLGAHVSVLLFPISFFASLLPILSIVSLLLGLYFSYLCLVKRCRGNDTAIKVIYFCFALIIVGSYFNL